MKLRIHRLAVAEIDHEVDDYESPCPLLPGLLSAALEKYAVRALALALEHVQVGERGGVEVRRGDRVLGDLAFVHWEDGKVADRHDRRVRRDAPSADRRCRPLRSRARRRARSGLRDDTPVSASWIAALVMREGDARSRV